MYQYPQCLRYASNCLWAQCVPMQCKFFQWEIIRWHCSTSTRAQLTFAGAHLHSSDPQAFESIDQPSPVLVSPGQPSPAITSLRQPLPAIVSHHPDETRQREPQSCEPNSGSFLFLLVKSHILDCNYCRASRSRVNLWVKVLGDKI